MARLTNYERDQILRRMKEDIQQGRRQKKVEIGEFLNPLLREFIPKEVLEFANTFPKYIDTSKNIWISAISESVPTIEHPVRLFDGRKSFIETILLDALYTKEKILFEKLIEEYRVIAKKETALIGKISCLLENITTEKRLKEEFPEAYSILKNKNQEETLCDTIENVRAELGSYKKEKK